MKVMEPHLAETWLDFAYSSAQNITVSHEASTNFCGTLSHVLTITGFLACGEQTLFSALVSLVLQIGL